MLLIQNNRFLWHGKLRATNLLRDIMRWYSASLAQRLAHYAYYHQKCWTKVTHYLGAVLIIFAFLIPLGWLQVGIVDIYEINVMWLLIIVWAFSFVLSNVVIAVLVGLLLFMLGVAASIFSLYAPNWNGLWVALGALLIGLMLQVVGYFIEGRRAVLRDDIAKVYFTPASLVSLLLFRFNLHQRLHRDVRSIVEKINHFS